ncbi:AraC family transcriptional regulator [Azonexus hydrophilus]|uniref:AraC family transcriptional regulator n=1 Tax=Azonexus hydrophilus TaxID=418702 RepID=A0A1R1I7U4_9RHOO|nr:AraC family transcriptional regulator [Azonexus hydrophilus]OMG54826.1 AraC family transcriptional regulator [Azonexus hydrophilus]
MDTAALTSPRPNDSSAMDNATLSRQRDEIAAILHRHCQDDGTVETAIPGLLLFRGSRTDVPTCAIMASVFALMVQGAKRITVGDETYDYDARHCLISSVDLPMFSRITRASASEPYLGLGLLLDPLKISELAAAIPQNRLPGNVDRGIAVGMLSAEIQGAALRLARLLDAPADIPVLAPIFERELLYRLLTSALGSRLRQAAASGSHSHQIVRAIDWLKSNLDQPISIDRLASLSNMSKSSLHHHFKALTAMTPLQYQKQMRLHEARRLMLATDTDAASAAHHVGYESPSQFNREYRRMFGTPPGRDIAQLRHSPP